MLCVGTGLEAYGHTLMDRLRSEVLWGRVHWHSLHFRDGHTRGETHQERRLGVPSVVSARGAYLRTLPPRVRLPTPGPPEWTHEGVLVGSVLVALLPPPREVAESFALAV